MTEHDNTTNHPPPHPRSLKANPPAHKLLKVGQRKRVVPGMARNISQIDPAKVDPRYHKVVEYVLFEGLCLRDAAIKAGFSPNYAKTSIYQSRTLAAMLDEAAMRVSQYSRAGLVALLPKLTKAIGKAVDVYHDDADKLIERPRVAELVLKSTGVLHSDTPQSEQSVTVNVQVLATALSRRLDGELDDK